MELSARLGNPKIYTVAPSQCFADALALGLMRRAGDDKAKLASTIILLPNRRAVRALSDAFLRLNDGRAMLMPAMRPLGDIDEGEVSALSGTLVGEDALKPAISETERQILLTTVVSRWGLSQREQIAPAQAWRLATALARLMDQVETEQLDFAGLKTLVEGELADHWQTTLDFLQIITKHWPYILAEKGLLNPADRRNKQMAALCDAWTLEPPKRTIVAAGSTGTMKATAELLKVVARLPEGMVVLPGLDQELDEDSWSEVGTTHPQFALKGLLNHIGEVRENVEAWLRDDEHSEGAPAERLHLLKEALRPAETTDQWRTGDSKAWSADAKARAKAGVDFLTLPTLREEAAAIALMMRETLETPARTAALVTPDRQLARQVAATLKRWDIIVDDSAGTPAANSPVGTFLRLITAVVASNFAPVPLLSLLQHPLAAAGEDREQFYAFVRRLDRFVLRGPRPAQGADGLLARGKQRLEQKRWSSADQKTLIKTLTLFAPLADLTSSHEVSPLAMLTAHLTVAESLGVTKSESGAMRIWQGDAGNSLANSLQNLMRYLSDLGDVEPGVWPSLFDAMIADGVVRSHYGKHPRLFIWGTIEARLQRADLMILGGLNEGTWPSEPTPDPWMSRPMRIKFGLPAPEKRVGQAAHDFVQAMGARDVVVTRAAKIDGTETVRSRWLYRMRALLGEALMDLPSRWAQWAWQLDDAKARPCLPPSPKPPISARPTSLPVTSIEQWMRDPYALYAKKILGLRSLEPVDENPNAAHKGNLVHNALEAFLKSDGPHDGKAGYDHLIKQGKAHFSLVTDQPAVQAFWWPRFELIAESFIDLQATRKLDFQIVGIEDKASRTVGETGFTVEARADRIDANLEDGSLVIIDYKTGGTPQKNQIYAGFAPQLPLEGWLAEADAFGGVKGAAVTGLEFWKMSGKVNAPLKIEPIDPKLVSTVIEEAEEGVETLIKAFQGEKTPYLSRPRPSAAGYGDYDHLARVLEWRASVADTESEVS